MNLEHEKREHQCIVFFLKLFLKDAKANEKNTSSCHSEGREFKYKDKIKTSLLLNLSQTQIKYFTDLKIQLLPSDKICKRCQKDIHPHTRILQEETKIFHICFFNIFFNRNEFWQCKGSPYEEENPNKYRFFDSIQKLKALNENFNYNFGYAELCGPCRTNLTKNFDCPENGNKKCYF
jgi:hypothetical protein